MKKLFAVLMLQFPLLSRSGLLKKLFADSSNEDGSSSSLQLHDVPGGDKTFEMITKFCYGVKLEITPLNVVRLRCAAEYLQMNEKYGEGNLVEVAETFLNEVFSNWSDSIKILQTCEQVKPYAEDLRIVSRCIDSLTIKACSEDILCSETKSQASSDDWWYEDLCLLSLPLYKRLILSIESKGMKPENIAASLIYYLRRFIPMMNRQSSFNDKTSVGQGTTPSKGSEANQRALLEEIVGLIPNKKCVTPSKYLLRLLKTAMILHASSSCIENLEKRIGSQLDQVELVDLLIPNMGYSVETLYDIDCIQRIVDHFMSMYQPSTAATSPLCIAEEGSLIGGVDALTPMTIVANLLDAYLAEVALDVNLKLPKFQALAASIPDYARPLDDGLYHAIDVYLKVMHASYFDHLELVI
jgi:hypothetical protein